MDITSFTYDALPGRIVFGDGILAERLPAELDLLGASRVLLISEGERPEATAPVLELLGERLAGHFDRVRMHVPAGVADAATEAANACDADVLLSFGGGSSTGTAKIVALRSGLPILAVPTTYAGSEVTPVWGLTTDARKETGRAPVVLPRTVLYDTALTATLPAAMAVASGFNAMAHSVEALWTELANPVTSALALEAVRALATGLRGITADPQDAEARRLLGYGSYLSGSCFGVAGSGLHHKLCHVLGGTFDLPHAQTHAVVLPYVLAVNAPTMGADAARLADALGADDAARGLRELAVLTGAPTRLADLGLRAEDLALAEEVTAAKLPIHNPTPVDRALIRDLLRHAFEGSETP